MTILNRFCPEMSDIMAIRLECGTCDAAISYLPDSWNTAATLKCPNCAVELVSPSLQTKGSIALRELAESLKLLRNTPNLGFRLRLEFDSPNR